jgi:hypothetical protein
MRTPAWHGMAWAQARPGHGFCRERKRKRERQRERERERDRERESTVTVDNNPR